MRTGTGRLTLTNGSGNFLSVRSSHLFTVTYQSLQPMLTYSGCGVGAAEAENGSPAGSLLSGEGELAEEAGDSPGTSRDTEEEATLSDEFYSHDTDEEDEQGKRRRDRSSSVSEI